MHVEINKAVQSKPIEFNRSNSPTQRGHPFERTIIYYLHLLLQKKLLALAEPAHGLSMWLNRTNPVTMLILLQKTPLLTDGTYATQPHELAPNSLSRT